MRKWAEFLTRTCSRLFMRKCGWLFTRKCDWPFTRKCGWLFTLTFYKEIWLTFSKEMWLTFLRGSVADFLQGNVADFLQGTVAGFLQGNVADFLRGSVADFSWEKPAAVLFLIHRSVAVPVHVLALCCVGALRLAVIQSVTWCFMPSQLVWLWYQADGCDTVSNLMFYAQSAGMVMISGWWLWYSR